MTIRVLYIVGCSQLLQLIVYLAAVVEELCVDGYQTEF